MNALLDNVFSMKNPSFRRSAIFGKVATYLNEKCPDIRWLIKLDHRIIADGRSVEYIIDIAGVDIQEKAIRIAVEIAATTIRRDGSRRHSEYELSGIPIYLLVDCTSGDCYLFESNGLAYEPIDITTMFPELPTVVASTIERMEA
jgi:Putative restriction endonuclease